MNDFSSFTGNPGGQLPENYFVPQDPAAALLRIRQYINDLAYATNRKSSGYFIEERTITGQQFVPTFGTDTSSSVQYRPVLRKVIDTGALPNAGTSTTAHGIATTENFTFVRIYGTATDPGASTITSAIPIPYSSNTANSNIEVSVDATNVVITTGIDYSAYTRSFVILEWVETT